jgi:predicted nucleic acid-binding protein
MEDYLLDTNTVIDYLEAKLPASALDKLDVIINERAKISIVTKMELLGWLGATDEDLHQIVEFVQDAYVIGLDDDITEVTINIRRQHRIKLPDAVIAATALAFDLTLITNNESDFAGIKDLKVLNPHKL